MVSSIVKALESNTTLHCRQVDGIDDCVCVTLENGLPKLRGLKNLCCRGFRLDAEVQ